MQRGIKSPIPAAIAAAIALLAAPFPARAAFDAFLNFTGPAPGTKLPSGDSLDTQFTKANGWMPIGSFDQSILNPIDIASATSGAGATKTVLNDFSFTRIIGPEAPSLFSYLATGAHFGKANLVLRQASPVGALNVRRPFYSAIMDTVLVKTINWSANSGDDAPREDVNLVYGALQWIFTSFDANGIPTTTLAVNWNQINDTGGAGVMADVSAPTLEYPASASVAAGGNITIQPTAGPSDPNGIASVIVKDKGGYTGGISVNSGGLIQITAAQPAGTFAILIEAANNLSVPKTATFNLAVGALPPLRANPDNAYRLLGQSIAISTANLLANDTAGATFDGLSTSTTALGGSVSLANGVISYTPPAPDPGTTDSFTYRIRDINNQTATASVTISIALPGQRGNLSITLGRATTLRLTATAGQKYQLQTAPDITGPWTSLGEPVTANPDSIAQWQDASPAGAARYYRVYALQ